MKKLLWLNVGGLAITLVLVWLQVQTGTTAREAMSHTMRLSQVSSQAEAIKTNMMQMSDAMRGFLLDTSRQDEWNRKLQADQELKSTVEAVKKITDDARLVGLIDRIGDLDEQKLDPAENKVLELAKTDREAAVKFYFAEYLPVRQEQMSLVEDLRQSAARMSSSFAANEMASMAARASFAVWVCGGFVLLMGIGVAISARTTSNLQFRIAQAAETMGVGALGVLSASRQVAHGSQTLAQNSAEQAASLEETSASMSEFRGLVERNSQHAGGAAQLMHEVEARVGEAMTALDSMVASMGEITESSGQISRIMRTVDEIAFQTNILALNAAVEAARAGEAGLGFAVVADEVRNLAQRSAEASRDTSGLIERSVTKTQQGAEKLDAVAAAIQAIEGRVKQTKGLFEQVNASSHEQAQRVEHVAEAVRQLEATTQQAAAIAQENAAASEEMSSQAESTQEIVGTLQSLVGASRASRGGVRTPVLASAGGGLFAASLRQTNLARVEHRVSRA